eukprot:16344-Hanusia_phi.AAC.2
MNPRPIKHSGMRLYYERSGSVIVPVPPAELKNHAAYTAFTSSERNRIFNLNLFAILKPDKTYTYVDPTGTITSAASGLDMFDTFNPGDLLYINMYQPNKLDYVKYTVQSNNLTVMIERMNMNTPKDIESKAKREETLLKKKDEERIVTHWWNLNRAALKVTPVFEDGKIKMHTDKNGISKTVHVIRENNKLDDEYLQHVIDQSKEALNTNPPKTTRFRPNSYRRNQKRFMQQKEKKSTQGNTMQVESNKRGRGGGMQSAFPTYMQSSFQSDSDMSSQATSRSTSRSNSRVGSERSSDWDEDSDDDVTQMNQSFRIRI